MLEVLKELLIEYPLVAPLLFILARMVPIVVAPIPGILVDIIGIAVFGWVYGFLLAEIGIMLGSIVAFMIGRYFREPVVRRFASLKKIHEWESKYSERQKFWSLVVVRATTSPLFDYVSYAAGLTKIDLGKYVLSTFIGTFPLMFSIYYFGGFSIRGGVIATAVFFLLLLLGTYFWNLSFNRKSSTKTGSNVVQ